MNAYVRRMACGGVLALAAACGHPGGGETAEAAGAPSALTGVDLAVATAQAIRAKPAATDSILGSHGLTRASFDALMYDIAADAALARTYADAMRDRQSP